MTLLEMSRHRELQRANLGTRKERYVAGIDKPSKITRSEVKVCGANVPVEMDGGLKKKDMQSKYDKETKAEKEHHWIRYKADKNDKLRYFEKLTMEEKRDLLVLSMYYVEEVRLLAVEGKTRDSIEPRD